MKVVKEAPEAGPASVEDAIKALVAKLPKKNPKGATLQALQPGEPCIIDLKKFREWGPSPLRTKEDSFRRQMNEWQIVKDASDAKGLPVKMWFTEPQQRQLWNRMKVATKQFEEGKKADAIIKTDEQRNNNLQCWLALDGVTWREFLVETIEMHLQTREKRIDATWYQRGELHTLHGFVEAYCVYLGGRVT